MPVNYMTNEVYHIDYEGLYEELMEKSFLSDARVQCEYVKLWISELRKRDVLEVEQFNDREFRKLILQEKLEAPEMYSIEMNYKAGTIYIFFRVSRLIQAIGTISTDMIQYIGVQDFVMKNSYIKWDRTELLNEIKRTPILLAPMTIDEYVKLVVIDGNHRLTSWIDNKEKIPCCILDGQAIIDSNMLCSGFSKLMYIFQNEVVALATYTMRDKIDAMLLMNKIYFRTGKLLFEV